MSLEAWMALPLALALYGGLFWLRSGHRGGWLGQRVRDSDWQSWRMAVEDKERELRELRAAEPKRSSYVNDSLPKEKL